MKLLNGASDWKVSADLKTSRQFPVHIIQTEKRPDIVAWSDSKKTILLKELTVPWEENREEAHEWKTNRYETLRADCVPTAWKKLGHAMWFLLRLVDMIFLDTQSFRFFQKLESLAAVWKLPQIVFRPRRNMHQIGFSRKREDFSMKVIHAEPPFLCDCVTQGNGYCKGVKTSMVESKRVFFVCFF